MTTFDGPQSSDDSNQRDACCKAKALLHHEVSLKRLSKPRDGCHSGATRLVAVQVAAIEHGRDTINPTSERAIAMSADMNANARSEVRALGDYELEAATGGLNADIKPLKSFHEIITLNSAWASNYLGLNVVLG